MSKIIIGGEPIEFFNYDWQTNHAEDLLLFPAIDCNTPRRLFVGGTKGAPPSVVNVVMQGFEFENGFGKAPTPFLGVFDAAPSDIELAGCVPNILSGLPVLSDPITKKILSVALVEKPNCGNVQSKIIVHDNNTPNPYLDSSFTLLPSGQDANLSFGINSINHMGAALAIREGTQLAFLGRRDGFLAVVDMDASTLSPPRIVAPGKIISTPVISANRWLIAGAGSTIAPEIFVMDLDTGQVMSSFVMPGRVVLPPAIGLDSFWYVVDLSETLHAFDKPMLSEGTLPSENLDEDDHWNVPGSLVDLP